VIGSTLYAACEGPPEMPHGRVIFSRWIYGIDGPIEGGCPVCTAAEALAKLTLADLVAARKGEEA